MTEEKIKPKKNRKKLIISFALAIGIPGIGGNLYLDDRADKELINIANHQDTASLECLQNNIESFKKQGIITGDNHDVIIIPGFATNDKYMFYLTNSIKDAGYNATGWGAGFNTVDTKTDAKILEDKIIDIYNNNGNQKISLIGYSLGGVYAREVTKKHEDKIRNVITISSPFAMTDKNGNLDKRIAKIYDAYDTNIKSYRTSLPVPSTSFISNHDLMVNWKMAIQNSTNISENIVLEKGHLSVIFSKSTINAVIERLSQNSDNWKSLAVKNCNFK